MYDIGVAKISALSLDLSIARERILFEDECLIAIDKPPGLPSQVTLDPKREYLAGSVRAYLANGYVGEVHRLDMGTSGVIIFGKTRESTARLTELFRTRSTEKLYLALAISGGQCEWRVKNHLATDRLNRKRMSAVRTGGQVAETEFRVVREGQGVALVEVYPKTGRRHQIRVHLKDSGMPILGDRTYAAAEVIAMAPRLMLHASRLTFAHPLSGEKITIEAPLPSDFKACGKEFF